MLFNLDFAIQFRFRLIFHYTSSFLIIDLYFLIPAAITQILHPIAELVISIGKPTKQAKAEIETHPLTVEIKISKCSIWLKTYKLFYSSYP